MGSIRVSDTDIVDLRTLNYLHTTDKYEEHIFMEEDSIKLCYTSKKRGNGIDSMPSRSINKYWMGYHRETGDLFYAVFYDSGAVTFVKDGSSSAFLSLAFPVTADKSYVESFFDLILEIPASVNLMNISAVSISASFTKHKTNIDYILNCDSLSSFTKLAAIISFTYSDSKEIAPNTLELVEKILDYQYPAEYFNITKLADCINFKNPGMIANASSLKMRFRDTLEWRSSSVADRPKVWAQFYEESLKVTYYVLSGEENDTFESFSKNTLEPFEVFNLDKDCYDRVASNFLCSIQETYFSLKSRSKEIDFNRILNLSKKKLLHLSLIEFMIRFSDSTPNYINIFFDLIMKSDTDNIAKLDESFNEADLINNSLRFFTLFLPKEDVYKIDSHFERFFKTKVTFESTHLRRDSEIFILEAFMNLDEDSFMNLIQKVFKMDDPRYFWRITSSLRQIRGNDEVLELFFKNLESGENFFDYDKTIPIEWVLATKGIVL